MLPRSFFVILASCLLAVAKDTECTVEQDGVYYDLNALKSKNDYVVRTASNREYSLNVCAPVNHELWDLENPTSVGAVYRGAHSDVSIGTVNTTITVVDGQPLLLMVDGSACPGESHLRSSTAIRFICDANVFNAGQPQLIAHFPLDEESACGFFFEWRTHIACPTAKPGSGVFAIIAIVILVLFVLYVVVGVLYRRLVLGMQGLDQFPRIPVIPLSKIKEFFSNIPDWFNDIRDHLRGGARDLWPRSQSTRWSRRRNDGFAPLAREEEEAMYTDQDGQDHRFSLEEDDITSPQQLHTPVLPNPNDNKQEGVIRL